MKQISMIITQVAAYNFRIWHAYDTNQNDSMARQVKGTEQGILTPSQ
jgi:hypothetical protein